LWEELDGEQKQLVVETLARLMISEFLARLHE
jgi:hypothetical protein